MSDRNEQADAKRHDGQRLRGLRLAAGLTQQELADRADINRGTVIHWEARESFAWHSWAPSKMCEAMGEQCWFSRHLRTRATMGSNWKTRVFGDFERLVAEQVAAARERERARLARRRVTCGAKTRQGHPCRLKSEPGRTRCKFHGGKSTGPRTDAGKRRISEAQTKRWENYRASKSRPDTAVADNDNHRANTGAN